MNSSYFQTLPSDVQSALSLIGISQDQQLHATFPAKVWQELEEARRYFPQSAKSLSQEQVIDIFRHLPDYKEPLHTPSQGEDFMAPGEDHPSEQLPKTLPTSEENSELACRFKPARKEHKHHDHSLKSHLIRNPRIFSTYVGAWSTLMMPILLFSTIVLIVNITLEGGKVDNTTVGCLACTFLVVLSYLILHNKALCPICSMKVFTFRRYNRNRHAHHIPLLGYTLPTALRIILTGRFCCPACGTGMRLSRKSSHRHHH